MSDQAYTKRELDHYFNDFKAQLNRIEEDNNDGFYKVHARLDITNGKVNRHTKILLVVGTTVGVLLATSGSELLDFILKVI